MANVLVRAVTPVTHDGGQYEAGEVIEMTEEQAAPLLEAGDGGYSRNKDGEKIFVEGRPVVTLVSDENAAPDTGKAKARVAEAKGEADKSTPRSKASKAKKGEADKSE